MQQLLHFLNANSGAFTVLFSAVVMVSTVVYAILTWKLVTETQRMRQVQTDPQIEITLRSVVDAIHIQRLHVRNIGLGAARSVIFQTEVLSGSGDAQALLNELTGTSFFATGLSYLGPSEERYSNYTDMSLNYPGKIKAKLAFRVSYTSNLRKKYSETIVIDMSEFEGAYQLGKPHMATIASSIEKMQKDLERIASGHKGMRADVFTSKDRKAEQDAIRARIEQSRKERGI